MNYAYDNIGQLKTANGYDHKYDPGAGTYSEVARAYEQFGYGYDAAWNLQYRTNNALVQTFNVDNRNQLTTATRSGTLTVAGTATEPRGDVVYGWPGVTNVTVSGTGLSSSAADLYFDGSWARSGAILADGNNNYTATAKDTYNRTSTDTVTVNLPATNQFVYDLNGNLRTNNTRIFDYDDENQLVRVTEPNTWKTEFTYDGRLRMRIRKEFAWNGSWTQTNEVRYVYDHQLVIQERDANNLPQVTYTRGNDLSCTLQGAGGIGGLLARTDNGQMIGGSPTATAYYFSDGSGNITSMVYTNGMIAARYSYDPFGNLITMNGSLAGQNKYRFSSKETHIPSGLYCFGFRFYDPNLQRWLNKDPLGENAGINLYESMFNSPVRWVDRSGLDIWIEGPTDEEPTGHQSINVGNPKGNYCSQSFGKSDGFTLYGEIYSDESKGGKIQDYIKTTPEQDQQALNELANDMANDKGNTLYGPTTCRTYSQSKFKHFKDELQIPESTPPQRTKPPRTKCRGAQDIISSSGKPSSSSDSSSTGVKSSSNSSSSSCTK
jgi:RHS repeat-associated protein